MYRKFIAAIALTTALVAWNAPAAQADPYAGACRINVSFYFNEVVRLLTIERGYAMEMNGTCPFILSGGTSSHSTFANGFGRGLMWNCELTMAEGDWTQWFDPGPPQVIDGGYTMAGSFGGWDMVVTAQNVVGHAHLVLATNNLSAPLACEGDGLWELHMTGVMEFVDA